MKELRTLTGTMWTSMCSAIRNLLNSQRCGNNLVATRFQLLVCAIFVCFFSVDFKVPEIPLPLSASANRSIVIWETRHKSASTASSTHLWICEADGLLKSHQKTFRHATTS